MEFSRTLIKHQMGDVAIDDAWKVERIDNLSFVIKPGEAWYDGLPYFLRSSADALVSVEFPDLGSGIVPTGTVVTDLLPADTGYPGKKVTLPGTTTTDSYRVVIEAQEQVVTNIEDEFIKSANLNEATAQKLRLYYTINIVEESLQGASLIPYKGHDAADKNLINKATINVGGAGSQGSVVAINPITGSEQIDGRDIEVIVVNDSSSSQNPLPKTNDERSAFDGGKLLDNVGNEFHIVFIQNDPNNTIGQDIIKIDKEVGQADPIMGLNSSYTLVKRDVYTTDSTNGSPLGKRFFPVAKIDWKTTSGLTHDSVITDMRNVMEAVSDSQHTANTKFDLTLAGGGLVTAEPSTKASGQISITSWTNLAGDTFDINGANFVEGVDFTAVTDEATTAAALSQAINDSQDPLIDGIVEATVIGGTVTVEATTGGVSGNSYVLSYTDGGSIGATVSNATFTGGIDSEAGKLVWDQDYKVVNPHKKGQSLITADEAVVLDGGSLAYFLDYDITADTTVSKGSLAVVTTNSGVAGTTITLSGSPDLSDVKIGNTIRTTFTAATAITAVDNVAKTIVLDGDLTISGSSTIYLDTFAAGTLPLGPSTFVVATRESNVMYLDNGVILNSGESNTGGVSQQLIEYIGATSETSSHPNYISSEIIGQGDNLTLAAGKLDAQVKTNLDNITQNTLDISQLSTTLQESYDTDPSATPVTITTDSGQGDLDIAGTESLVVSADGGLNVTGGVTQTKAINLTSSGSTASFLVGSSGLALSSSTIQGESFLATVTNKLSQVTFSLQNIAPATGSVSCDIYLADGSGFPTGTVLESSSPINVATIPASFQPTSFIFSETLTITAGISYVVVLNGAAITSQINMAAELTNAANYPDGNMAKSTNGGTSWSSVVPSWDFYFDVTVANSGTSPNIQLHGSASGTIDLSAAPTTTDYPIVLPDSQGAAGQAMTNDGSGNLSWTTPSGGGSGTDTLQEAYDIDTANQPVVITTDSGQGDIDIAGTESLVVSADGGVNVTSGTTQTQSTSTTTITTVASASSFDNNLSFDSALTMYGQSFQTTVSANLKEIRLNTTSETTDDWLIKIYPDDLGTPGTPDTTTLLASSVPVSAPFFNAPLPPFVFLGIDSIALATGTLYHLVLDRNSVDGNFTSLATSTSDVYASGTRTQSLDGGSTWSTTPAADLYFDVDVTSTVISPNIQLHGSTSGTAELTAAPTTTDYRITLPDSQGTLGDSMVNDGSGNLSWQENIPSSTHFDMLNNQTTRLDVDGFLVDPAVHKGFAADVVLDRVHSITSAIDTAWQSNVEAATQFILGTWGQALLQQTDGKTLHFHQDGTTLPQVDVVRLNIDGTDDVAFRNNQPGIIDPAFIQAAALQPDGKILVGGTFKALAGVPTAGIFRLNVDGSLDTSFTSDLNIPAPAGGSQDIKDIYVLDSGDIIVTGRIFEDEFSNGYGIAKLSATGTFNTTFQSVRDAQPAFNSIAYASAILSDESVVLFPVFGAPIRVSSTGVENLSFTAATGSGCNSAPFSAVAQADDKIIVVGQFSTYDGVTAGRIARINPDGTFDTNYNIANGSGFINVVNQVTLSSDGRAACGGTFTSFDGTTMNQAAILTEEGALDSRFQTHTIGSGITSVLFHSDGDLLIDGQFNSVDGTPATGVAKLVAPPASNKQYTLRGFWDGGQWNIGESTHIGGNVGIDFTMTNLGQLQYTSTNRAGAQLSNFVRFMIRKL